jgi:hypothetical protein
VIRRSHVLSVLTLSLCQSVSAATYLCVAENAAGFKYNKTTKAWEATTFQTHSKWLIRPRKAGEPAMEVVEVGQEQPSSVCASGILKSGWLACDGLNTFWFNAKNGRYQTVGSPAYVVVGTVFATDTDAADSWMEMGTCSEVR